MDREEVYKQNRELCMKVPIGTVLNGIGIRVNRKGECLCPNPAHGDKRLGNCRIRPKFNTLQCFACQKVWNPISIVMEWEGLRYVDALRRVADIGGVVLEEVDAFDELADEFAEQKGPKPIQMPNADECEMLGIDMSGIECITGVYPFKPENLPKDVYLREAAVEEYLSKKERDMLDRQPVLPGVCGKPSGLCHIQNGNVSVYRNAEDKSGCYSGYHFDESNQPLPVL